MNVTNFCLIIYSKSFFQRDLVENYVINRRLIAMRFLSALSIERPWVVSPCTWRLRSDHFLPIGAQSRLAMQFSALRLTCGLGFRAGRHGVGRRTSVHGRLSRPWGFWVWCRLARRRSAVIGLSTATTHRLTCVQCSFKNRNSQA